MQMKQPTEARRPVIVSFSGMDGAGKSTQIDNLFHFLEQAGYHVQLLAFWDQVARLVRLREWMSLHLFKGDPGVGTPERPVNRRDKNIQSPYLNCIRFLLYFFDALSISVLMARIRKADCDVVIFDRYLYDELANLPLARPVVRSYAAVLLKLFPHPDIAFLLDADPLQARARKPEYPIEFLHRNRAAYLSLGESTRMVVVPAMSESDVTDRVIQEIAEVMKFRTHEDCEPLTSHPGML